MAETVYLLDGSTEVIFGDRRDFMSRLLREKLGDDAERLFMELSEISTDERAALEDQANEFERNADGYRDMCFQALECLRRIYSELYNNDRVNKKALFSLVTDGINELNNNL